MNDKTGFITFHDVQGLIFGIVLTTLGVFFIQSAGLVTGQTAGLALLLSYLADCRGCCWHFGVEYCFLRCHGV